MGWEHRGRSRHGGVESALLSHPTSALVHLPFPTACEPPSPSEQQVPHHVDLTSQLPS